ncbi:toxin-antitoxin system [Levilactobacillus tongjiangensis]|uniref:Toxin-antitoxin system n=1 Tax=Levilactobacillus tongjiangensis TaxID=2486023 RepID=A0ABW1SRD1_9LACO|nr:toxin-antitoxin system [Levilactobacillus tongjiangensis]
MNTKTRKQGNSITLTVPSDFNIKPGVTVSPKLTPTGIFYEFVNNEDIFDFDTDILQDLLAQDIPKDQLLSAFKKKKKSIPHAIEALINDTSRQELPITKAELAAELDL